MTRFYIYREHVEPYYVDFLINQTLQEKIHFAKKLLSVLEAIQIEFWHASSRYTIEFDIQNTI